MNAVEAGKRRTAGAWVALVAGFRDVIEIVATGSLQQIAAGRGLVTQLRAGARQQCAAQDTVALPHAGIGREIAVANQRTNAQASFGCFLNLVEWQVVDID